MLMFAIGRQTGTDPQPYFVSVHPVLDLSTLL
jgi:hypothetical protein